MILVLALNSIPLNDPRLGPLANLTFILTNILEVACAVTIIVAQLHWMIPELKIGFIKGAIIVIGYTVAHLDTYMRAMTLLQGFPVPFPAQIGTIEGFPVVIILILFFTRNPLNNFRGKNYMPCFNFRTFEETPNCARRVKNFIMVIATQTMLIFVYSGFGAAFYALDGMAQTFLTLLLPLFKILFKFIATKFTEEFTPELAPITSVFTSELFNAIYVSICLQQAKGGLVTLAMIMSYDFAQNHFYLHKFTQIVRGKEPLPPTVEERRSSRVIPTTKNESFTQKVSNADPKSGTLVDDPIARRRFLHTTEHLALTEYVEIITPIIYSTYSCFMFFNPNRQWISGLRIEEFSFEDLTGSLQSLVFYSALEIFSFAILHYKVKKLLKINTLHQLAFVLRKHKFVAFAFMTTWIIVIMGFQRDHNGADFSFQFAWLKQLPPQIEANTTMANINTTTV